MNNGEQEQKMNQFLTYMQRSGVKATLLMILAVCVLATGCDLLKTTRIGDLQSETQSVELGSADSATVQINMGAGELTVAGGADGLMDAAFSYNVADWKPSVMTSSTGDQISLMVEQGDSDIPTGATVVNKWDLRLSSRVPLGLEIQTGASNSDLDLHDLNLMDLQITTGVGATNIDLSGGLDHDLHAAVESGVGALSVKLPSDMGVRVSANTGLGGLSNAGLFQDGDYFVNEAYNSAPHTLFLDVNAGIGGIELLAQ